MNKKALLSVLLTTVTACVFIACQKSPESEKDAGFSSSPSSSSSEEEIVFDPGNQISHYIGNTITVNSSEKVTIIPDIAEIVYSVRTQAKNAASCQQENTASVSQVIELLKGLNVAEASIQTSDYYMNPIYDYSGNTARITGYEATTTLTVSDLPIDGLDNILAKSVDGGINTIQSITYMASRYDESYHQALTNAVSAAYEKASVLAQAAGCTVGNVISIQETSGYSEARYTDTALTNMSRSMKQEAEYSLADTTGIMPGEIQIEASIVVEYQLNE